MHSLHDVLLVVQAVAVHRHAPGRRRISAPASHNVGVESTIGMRQFDITLAHALRAPSAIIGTAASDAFFALAADVAVVIEAVVGGAAAGGDALVVGGEVEAVGGVGAVGGFEGAEAEDAGDEGPEVGDVGDDDGGGGFAGVPVQVDEGAVARGEVVVAV